MKIWNRVESEITQVKPRGAASYIIFLLWPLPSSDIQVYTYRNKSWVGMAYSIIITVICTLIPSLITCKSRYYND